MCECPDCGSTEKTTTRVGSKPSYEKIITSCSNCGEVLFANPV